MKPRIPASVAALAVAAALVIAPATARAAAGVEGGRPIFAAGGVRCVLGFNVRRSDTYYFLTAGGCARTGTTIYADPGLTVVLGTVAGVANGGVGLVRYTNDAIDKPGSVHTYPGSQDIVSAGDARVGQNVCRTGPVTGLRCGTVTAVNQSVNFPEGTIHGLTRTTICPEPGETGAPYFTGTTALGLGLGGSGNCTTGGTSFYQPISPVLSAFGVTVY